MYEIFDHTADLGLRIRAESLDGLFEEAAVAMFSVVVTEHDSIRPDHQVSFELSAARRDENPEAALLLSQRAFMGFFLLAPTVYPWYLAWTLPFLCLDRSLPWLLLTGTVFAFYAHDLAGHHQEIWRVTSMEYALPPTLAIGLRLRRPTPSPPPH